MNFAQKTWIWVLLIVALYLTAKGLEVEVARARGIPHAFGKFLGADEPARHQRKAPSPFRAELTAIVAAPWVLAGIAVVLIVSSVEPKRGR